MHIQQTTIARLINITNQATPPGTKDWRRTLNVRVYYNRLEIHTPYSIVSLPASEWRLELDPAIPNRAIIRPHWCGIALAVTLFGFLPMPVFLYAYESPHLLIKLAIVFQLLAWLGYLIVTNVRIAGF